MRTNTQLDPNSNHKLHKNIETTEAEAYFQQVILPDNPTLTYRFRGTYNKLDYDLLDEDGNVFASIEFKHRNRKLSFFKKYPPYCETCKVEKAKEADHPCIIVFITEDEYSIAFDLTDGIVGMETNIYGSSRFDQTKAKKFRQSEKELARFPFSKNLGVHKLEIEYEDNQRDTGRQEAA